MAEGNVVNLLGMANTAMIGGNNQEALEYFNRALEIDPTISEAWLGKGKAAGWQSTLVNIRLQETAIAFSHAIANAPDPQKAAVAEDAANEMNKLSVAIYGLARNHMIEFANLDNIWQSYLNQVSQLIDALDQSRTWTPQNRDTLENIIHFCKDNIEGYSYRDKFNNNMPAAHGITAQYEQFLRQRMDQASNSLRLIDPSYTAPVIDKKKADACFVVTATMGSADHPDVLLLRRFRDDWIAHKPGGSLFIEVYYRVGPLLAAIIQRSRLLRGISRRVIVRPAARFAKKRRGG